MQSREQLELSSNWLQHNIQQELEVKEATTFISKIEVFNENEPYKYGYSILFCFFD